MLEFALDLPHFLIVFACKAFVLLGLTLTGILHIDTDHGNEGLTFQGESRNSLVVYGTLWTRFWDVGDAGTIF